MPSEDVVRGTVNTIFENEFSKSEIKIKAISNPGGNYTSALFNATVSSPERNEELFVKVGTMGSDLGASHIFETEHYIYTELAPVFEQLQDKNKLSDHRYVFPKYYGLNYTDGQPTMVMENLVARGYDAYERTKSVDWEYASKSMEVLAKFHALSLSYAKERREEYLEIGKKLTMPPWEDGEKWQELIDRAVELADEKFRSTVAKYLEGCAGWSKLIDFTRPRKTAVVVHGDFRPSNLMQKVVDGKLDVIPVDYQTVRFGCPVSDLVYFIVMGSDRQFREQHFHQLINHYYHQLTMALARLGIRADEVYGREEYDADLKEKLPFGLYIGAMSLPFALVSPQHAPRFERGEFVPPRGELFAERFRDLVRDWARWGII